MNAKDQCARMAWFAFFREELFAAWWDCALRQVPFWQREFAVGPAAYAEAQRLGIKRWGGMYIKPETEPPLQDTSNG